MTLNKVYLSSNNPVAQSDDMIELDLEFESHLVGLFLTSDFLVGSYFINLFPNLFAFLLFF
jgi:hypothetical protein